MEPNGEFPEITQNLTERLYLQTTYCGNHDSNIVLFFKVFTPEGVFLREIFSQGKGKGRYGGLACDNHGFLLATRTEKAKSFIQVCE